MKIWLRESKTFSKSIAIRMPSLLFLFAYFKISLIVLIVSKIDLPFINAFWLWWTRKGKIDPNLIAIVLGAILTSMFINKIGRNLFRSLLSLSFFPIRLIIACFWKVYNSPWQCVKFRISRHFLGRGQNARSNWTVYPSFWGRETITRSKLFVYWITLFIC